MMTLQAAYFNHIGLGSVKYFCIICTVQQMLLSFQSVSILHFMLFFLNFAALYSIVLHMRNK